MTLWFNCKCMRSAGKDRWLSRKVSKSNCGSRTHLFGTRVFLFLLEVLYLDRDNLFPLEGQFGFLWFKIWKLEVACLRSRGWNRISSVDHRESSDDPQIVGSEVSDRGHTQTAIVAGNVSIVRLSDMWYLQCLTIVCMTGSSKYAWSTTRSRSVQNPI